MMIPSIVITDFDGTLLNDDKQISSADLTALDTLRHHRVKVAIATGRSMASFGKAMSQMNLDRKVSSLPIDYVIFSTGAGVLSFPGKELLFNRSISAKDTVQITQYFDAQQMDYMVHKAVPDTQHLLYKSFGRENEDFHHRLSLYRSHARALDIFENQFERITEVLAVLPVHHGSKTVSKIRRDLPRFSVIPATSPLDHQSLWIEVFNKEVSKSKTAAWLCRQLKIEPKQVLAIGNDYNDQDLLAWAGKAVVVENAPDQLKTSFAIVASNNCSGFGMAVNDIGL